MATLGLTSAAAGTQTVASRELHVDPANITAHPLFEDAEEEYAELFGTNVAFGGGIAASMNNPPRWYLITQPAKCLRHLTNVRGHNYTNRSANQGREPTCAMAPAFAGRANGRCIVGVVHRQIESHQPSAGSACGDGYCGVDALRS